MISHTYSDAFLNKETRKCSTCGKPLPDGYVKKTCGLCLEKAKARYTVEMANKELARENKKMVKNLLSEGLPKIYWDFSTYQEYWGNQGIEKSYEDYQKEVEEWQRNNIRAKANKEADAIHHQHKSDRRFVSRFLRPDLYPFTEKEKCKEFRFQKLGLHSETEPFLTDHINEDFCESCKEWLYQLEHSNMENYLLQSEPDEEGFYYVAFIILRKENLEPEAKKILKEFLADSVVLELPSVKDGIIWKVNVFCDPNKLKEIPREPSGCVGTAWGRPHNESQGDNLWGSHGE